jgi:hypothetical protein
LDIWVDHKIYSTVPQYVKRFPLELDRSNKNLLDRSN